MIIVLQLKGKGQYSKADYVHVHKFSHIDDAEAFVIANTYPEVKYWSVASIIDAVGEEYETTVEALL